MGYSEQYDAARTALFLKKLEIALVVAARDVAAEPKATVNHYNRVTMATTVLRAPDAWVPAFKDAVAVNLVTDASTDGDFYAAVWALWDGYAGLTHNSALT